MNVASVRTGRGRGPIIATVVAGFVAAASSLVMAQSAPGYMPPRPNVGAIPTVPPAPAPAPPLSAPVASPDTAPAVQPDADAAAIAPAIDSGAPANTTPVLAGQPGPDIPATENPYGLGALWAQGDFVARGTLLILVAMSFSTWFLAAMRLWDQQVLLRHHKTAGGGFWSADSVREGAALLETDSAFRSIVEAGLRAAEHQDGKLTARIEEQEWVAMAVSRAVDATNFRLQSGLAFIASVASTAPFVGLFGTVWGIYHALIAIGIAGQASIDRVAGPVGEALIMTAIGLAVAVPAVLFYNWLVRRNKVVLEQIRYFAADVQAVLLAGRKSGPPLSEGRRP